MNIWVLAIIFIVGLMLGYLIRLVISTMSANSRENRAQLILEKAKREVEARKKEQILEMRELEQKTREKIENSFIEQRSALDARKRKVTEAEENLNRKLALVTNKEHDITQREQQCDLKEQDITSRIKMVEQRERDCQKRMEQIAHMNQEDARRQMMKQVERETREKADALVRRIEQEAEEKANREAKRILSIAIQRTAADFTADVTTATIPVPEEMKGRIIGREGRNIKAFETATGCDLIVDDTPEVITVSCFDGVRREIGRRSLERLIADGRIQPTRIEEIVERVTKELDSQIKEQGAQVMFDLGIHGVHPELVYLVGKLRYRSSYGQNVLRHSIEVANAAGALASEIGADTKIAKRAGILHDIGKAIDSDVEGPHAKIGADIARKYGETPRVVNAIAAHHEEVAPEYVESILVASADAISAARPGGRIEGIERYIQRMEKLENIAKSFKGVERAFAIQAGREVRVLVEPSRITDEGTGTVASDIAREIEKQLEYPGQVKVTVIREIRATGIAK